MAHRGHGTYIFISRDKKKKQFIARYKNVGTVSSMGHRSYVTYFLHFLIKTKSFAICTCPIIYLVCPPKVLHNLCFSFLLSITAVSGETENNAYANLGGGQTRSLFGDVQVANAVDNNMLEMAYRWLHSVPYYNLQKGFVDL